MRTGRSEGRQNGIDILEMNSGRKQIGGRQVGNGDMSAFVDGGTVPAATCWDTERPLDSTHRSTRRSTRGLYTVRSIGNRRAV